MKIDLNGTGYGTIKTPGEIMKQRATMLRVLISKTVTDIAKELEANYIGEPLKIALDGHRDHFEKILPELAEQFGKKHWNIKIAGQIRNQDEARTEFLLTPKIFDHPTEKRE